MAVGAACAARRAGGVVRGAGVMVRSDLSKGA